MHVRHRALAALVLPLLFAPLPARAIPGQTAAQFASWSKSNKLLVNLEKKKDELSGNPMWEVTTFDHGVGWLFSAHADGASRIASETLGVTATGSETFGSAPIRHDGTGYGFTFFTSVYGKTIAADFVKSKPVATLVDPTNKATTAYYASKKYGYALTAGVLTISTPAQFARDLAQSKKCDANPQSCSE